MQLLLSCAKTMTERSSVPTPRTTRPAYRSEASELAAGLATLPTDELARLLRVNRRIAAENRLRYGRFHGDDDAAIPALTAYTGIVFKRIDPASFSAADLEYAQEHLNITSFLYGVLRPLDAIRPYRLEGDAVLPGHDEQTLFAYWHERLTDALLDKIRRDDGILVNLASGEMKRLFDWKRVCREVRVITPEFRIREGDPLEIYTSRDGEVIFKKYSLMGGVSEFAGQLCETIGRTAGKIAVITDRDNCVAVTGAPRREIQDKQISPELERLMEGRQIYQHKPGAETIPLCADGTAFHVGTASPILSEGDVLGCVLFAGTDNDMNADWDNGVFYDNFRGVWGALDGNLVYMELSFDGEDYNLYSVPILLNGEAYNLQVAYEFDTEEWSILGATQGLDPSGMASKERRLLKEGDVVTNIWKLATLSGDDEFEMYAADEVTVTADTAFGEAPLFDGTYSMVIEMRDVAGNYAYSDAVSFECVDGQVTSTTIYED